MKNISITIYALLSFFWICWFTRSYCVLWWTTSVNTVNPTTVVVFSQILPCNSILHWMQLLTVLVQFLIGCCAALSSKKKWQRKMCQVYHTCWKVRKQGWSERHALKGAERSWRKKIERNMHDKAAAGHKLVSPGNILLIWICTDIAPILVQGHVLQNRGSRQYTWEYWSKLSWLKSHARSKSVPLAQNIKESGLRKKGWKQFIFAGRVKNW